MYKVYFWFELIFFFRANSKLTQILYVLSPTQVENDLKWRKCPMWGYFSSQIVTNGTWVERLPQSLSPPNYLRICGLQLKIAEEGGLGNQTKVKETIWTRRLGCKHFSSFNIFWWIQFLKPYALFSNDFQTSFIEYIFVKETANVLKSVFSSSLQ